MKIGLGAAVAAATFAAMAIGLTANAPALISINLSGASDPASSKQISEERDAACLPIDVNADKSTT